jgi:hypothetical protein
MVQEKGNQMLGVGEKGNHCFMVTEFSLEICSGDSNKTFAMYSMTLTCTLKMLTYNMLKYTYNMLNR